MLHGAPWGNPRSPVTLYTGVQGSRGYRGRVTQPCRVTRIHGGSSRVAEVQVRPFTSKPNALMIVIYRITSSKVVNQ